MEFRDGGVCWFASRDRVGRESSEAEKCIFTRLFSYLFIIFAFELPRTG